MGCFNHYGMHSHLPIKYGDKIVWFICAKVTESNDNLNLEQEPICLPVFGRYDDYGGIQNIEETLSKHTVEAFFGMTIKEMNDACNEAAFSTKVTVKDIEVNKFNESNVSNYEKMLNKLIDSNEYVKKYYENEVSLFTTMERYDIFEKMSEFALSQYRTISSDIIDDVMDSVDELKKLKVKNIFNPNFGIAFSDELFDTFDDYKEVDKRLKQVSAMDMCYDTRGWYTGIALDAFPNLRYYGFHEDIKMFLGFNKFLLNNGGKYTTSSYCHQDTYPSWTYADKLNRVSREIIDNELEALHEERRDL